MAGTGDPLAGGDSNMPLTNPNDPAAGSSKTWTGTYGGQYGTFLLDGPGGTPGTFIGDPRAPSTSSGGGSTATSYTNYTAPNGPYGGTLPAGTIYSVGSNGAFNVQYSPPRTTTTQTSSLYNDANGDGFDDQTGLPNGVIRIPGSENPQSGFLGLWYQGIPVNADGSRFTGATTPTSTAKPNSAGTWTGQGPKGYGTYYLDGPNGAPGTFIGDPSKPSAAPVGASLSGSGGGSYGGGGGTSAGAGGVDANVSAQLANQLAIAKLNAAQDAADAAARSGDIRAQIAAQAALQAAQLAAQQAQFDAQLAWQREQAATDTQFGKVDRGLALANAYKDAINSVDPTAYSAFLYGADRAHLNDVANPNNPDTIAASLAAGRNAVSPEALKPAADILDQINALNSITAPGPVPTPAPAPVPTPTTGSTSAGGGSAASAAPAGYTTPVPYPVPESPAGSRYDHVLPGYNLENWDAPGNVGVIPTNGTAPAAPVQAIQLDPTHVATASPAPATSTSTYMGTAPRADWLIGTISPKLATGGYTTAPQAVVGDSTVPFQQNQEFIENPTHAPLRITPMGPEPGRPAMKTPRYATGTGEMTDTAIAGPTIDRRQQRLDQLRQLMTQAGFPTPRMGGRSQGDDARQLTGLQRAMLQARSEQARASIAANMARNQAAGVGPVNRPPGYVPPVGGVGGVDWNGPALSSTNVISTAAPAAVATNAPGLVGFTGAFPTANAAAPAPAPHVGERPGDQTYAQATARAPFSIDPKTGHMVPHFATGTGYYPAYDPNRFYGAARLLSSVGIRTPRVTGTGGSTGGSTSTSGSPSTSPTTGGTVPTPAPPPGGTTNSAGGGTTSPTTGAGGSSSTQTVLDQRMNTQYPHLNPYSTGYWFMDPTLRAQYELGQQATTGVPVASQEWEYGKYRTPSGIARIGA